MEEISSNNIKSAEDLIKLGKNIGDEMDPNMNVDNSSDGKISIETIVNEEKILNGEKISESTIEDVKIEKIKDNKKNNGFLGLILVFIVVIIMSVLVSWFFIF